MPSTLSYFERHAHTQAKTRVEYDVIEMTVSLTLVWRRISWTSRHDWRITSPEVLHYTMNELALESQGSLKTAFSLANWIRGTCNCFDYVMMWRHRHVQTSRERESWLLHNWCTRPGLVLQARDPCRSPYDLCWNARVYFNFGRI